VFLESVTLNQETHEEAGSGREGEESDKNDRSNRKNRHGAGLDLRFIPHNQILYNAANDLAAFFYF